MDEVCAGVLKIRVCYLIRLWHVEATKTNIAPETNYHGPPPYEVAQKVVVFCMFYHTLVEMAD
jgi:hypothetical protein